MVFPYGIVHLVTLVVEFWGVAYPGVLLQYSLQFSNSLLYPRTVPVYRDFTFSKSVMSLTTWLVIMFRSMMNFFTNIVSSLVDVNDDEVFLGSRGVT